MKFHCICMSPAIDSTLVLPEAPENGEVIRVISETETAGGKALNVARYLASLGNDVECGGLLGVENQKLFADALRATGVKDRFVRVPGLTRRNEMLTWRDGGVKINRPAFPSLREFDENAFIAKLADVRCDVAILSGSLPAVCSADFYAKALRAFKANGVLTVLDSSGEAFVRGVAAEPDAIKPNAAECAALVGFMPDTPDEFRRATSILSERVNHVIISDGERGAWFDGVRFAAPRVDVVDSTGAGDAMLAEWCHRHYAMNDASAPEHAVLAGSAACTVAGPLTHAVK